MKLNPLVFIEGGTCVDGNGTAFPAIHDGIPGASALEEAGIVSLAQLAGCDAEALQEIDGVGKTTATKLEALLAQPPHTWLPDDDAPEPEPDADDNAPDDDADEPDGEA